MHREHQKERFVRLCNDHSLSIENVCEALDIARTTYYNWRRQFMPPGFRKEKLQYLRFIDLYEPGNLTLARIAELLGCWPGTVWRYKQRYLREDLPQSATDSTLPENERPGAAGAAVGEPVPPGA
ncbi:MAG: helix-turn-helix domain-containing protein [Bacteroidota bacterium]